MSAKPPLITLLTDFGQSDTYVGQVKGAILSVCPEARLVDLTHEIAPGDLRSAAILWADAVRVFPAGTVHLAVVDPGVGSFRRAIAAEIGSWRFVCPDNGLATCLLQRWPLKRAIELTNRRWWRDEVSSVFHGRDIFGPIAGHWAGGRDISAFGPDIPGPLTTCALDEVQRDGRRLMGTVQSIDRFGNLITNLPADVFLEPHVDWLIQIGPHQIAGLSSYYSAQPPGTLMTVIGSHGRLEVAVNQGDAAQRLGADVGMSVTVERC